MLARYLRSVCQLLFLAPWVAACAADTDAEEVDEPTSAEVEGSITVSVSSKAQLLSALASATPGTIIKIAPTATINLTGHRCGGGASNCLGVPEGVTIDGGRASGVPGALLFTDDRTDLPERGGWMLMKTLGPNVTFRNLRLQGPDGSIGSPDGIIATGIQISHDSATVTGLEIYNWPGAAIAASAKGALVERNYIHHTMRAERGYGVVTSDTTVALIQYNRFDFNRHAIAGGSKDALGWYEARYNSIGTTQTAHSFDMHGSNESLKDNSTNAAGRVIYAHHNRFYSSQPTMMVRGVPTGRAWNENNCGAAGASSFAIQSFVTFGDPSCPLENGVRTCREFVYPPAPMTNMFLSNNVTGASEARCDALPYGTGPRWCVATASALRELAPAAFDPSELAFGDFDGDGNAEVLRANGQGWRTLVPSNNRTIWGYLSGSTFRARDLRVGDFNGDGKDDVMSLGSAGWQVQWGGRGGWRPLNMQANPMSALSVGDFNGDGKADVVLLYGGVLVSWGGTTGLARLNAQTPAAGEWLVGDFNGDGKDDLLWTTGTEWRVSAGGSGAWTRVNGSAMRARDLLVGDFDGDGKDDLLAAFDGAWRISSAAHSSWKVLRTSSTPVSNLRRLKKKTGTDDVFVSGCTN